ncbi:hypothetical protein WKK05_05590 [Nostoc sp. UHCC 0302]|uniref:hypothetical protein n=1 Tax=Nostoc sp. UHCC 0302 TaxID=3134896 RepID=UPI00311CB121
MLLQELKEQVLKLPPSVGVARRRHRLALVSANINILGLMQKLSQTLIPPCPLRPLWFDFPLPVRKS